MTQVLLILIQHHKAQFPVDFKTTVIGKLEFEFLIKFPS